MKKIILFSALIMMSATGMAQVDTLYTIKGKKIPCKIYEINDFEMRYRLASNLEGPVFVIDKSTIQKYTLSSGYAEVITPDEMSLENEHREILGNREVIKIHPFSFAFNHVSLAYEKVIRVGMNIDAEVGYINNTISQYQTLAPNGYGNPFTTGAYIKPGLKFFLGQDFSVRGLKYAHPLKGRYIKLDLAFAYLNFQNVNYTTYSYGYNGPIYSPTTYSVISSDVTALSFGGFVNYGRQFILGNMLTLDYYFGVGFTGQSISYSNRGFTTAYQQGRYGFKDFSKSVSNYYGYARIPGLGLSGTFGFRIGYILPSKKSRIEKKAESIRNKNQ